MILDVEKKSNAKISRSKNDHRCVAHTICYEIGQVMDGIFGLIAAVSLIGWIATRYSIWCLPLLVSVAILAEDDCYPLSFFPMYSDPDESENFLFVATWETDPTQYHAIPIEEATGLSAPKVKKMWKSYSRDFADDLKKKDTELTDEETNEISGVLLKEFRKVAANQGKELPENLALVEVWIEATDIGGWTETPEVLGTISSSTNASTTDAAPALAQ